MSRHNVILLFILNILFFSSAKGQTYYNKNYTVDNGLPSSEIFHVIQDKRGFIWIATNQGLSRFDGYEFVNFDNQSGLPRNTILELFEDDIGRIWCVSLTGELSWFEDDSIHIYPYNDLILNFNKGSFGRPLKRSFYVDSLDNIYIGFNMKPLIKISKSGVLTIIESKSKSNRQVLKVLPDNHLVFSSYCPVQGIEVQAEGKPDMTICGDYPYDTRFSACCVDGGYVFAILNDLYYIKHDGTVKKYSFDHPIIWVSQDSDANIWLGFLWGGSIAYSDLELMEKKYFLLENESVSSVTRDIEGGYWISTIENGVFYFPSLKIATYTEINGHKISSVNHIERNQNKVLFVANNKDFYDIKDGVLNRKNNDWIDEKIEQVIFLKNIGDSIFFSFFGDSDKNLKIIYNEKEVWSFNQETRDVVFIGGDTLLRTYSSIRFINMDGNVLNRKVISDKFKDIYTLVKVSKNIVWLGTENGLFEYSIKLNEIRELNLSKVLRNRINCFYKDQGECIWIGTKGAGLLRMEGNEINQFTTSDGLPGNSINKIEKKDDVLWLATNNGIGKIHLKQARKKNDNLKNSRFEVEKFTRSNGLVNNEIFDIVLNKENVFAGTNSGLSYFNQNLSGINKIAPSIYFTQVKILNEDTIIQNHYELEYDQNYIEFDFTGLSYQCEKELQYAYMLEGVNSDWVKTINRSANFPLLPPGVYTFKVKVYNRSGIESKTKSITFKINKAIYQTFWFKVSIVAISLLVIVLIFMLFYYTKMKEIKKRNSINDELNKYRQRALSAQMNPHFIYNSLNSVQSYILKNDREKSSTYLSKFGKLMRRVLDNSQNSLISLYEEVDALKVYVEMELIRFRNSFNFELQIDDNIDLEEIKVPPLIIQPYVENAIHHGLRMKKDKKNLQIKISSIEERIRIAIEDDGIGRKESKRIRQQSKNRLKSQGTEITDKRLTLFKELYKNDVDIRIIDLDEISNGSKGTRVEIYIFNQAYNN